MKITVKKLSELHKPAHNIRRHSEKQLTEYIRSIEMFGQVKPLVVAEDGEIIAGNGLYEALLRMSRETCDCYVMVGLTDVQKKKLMMADNKVYELGFTDVDAIEELVKELDGDVDVPGWDADLLEMRILFKMVLAPISLFVAFLALMAKWLLTLSSYIVAPLMLYIFGCGIYTVYRQTWNQFLILLVAEFFCFVLFVGATAMVEGVEKFSGWLRDLI